MARITVAVCSVLICCTAASNARSTNRQDHPEFGHREVSFVPSPGLWYTVMRWDALHRGLLVVGLSGATHLAHLYHVSLDGKVERIRPLPGNKKCTSVEQTEVDVLVDGQVAYVESCFGR